MLKKTCVFVFLLSYCPMLSKEAILMLPMPSFNNRWHGGTHEPQTSIVQMGGKVDPEWRRRKRSRLHPLIPENRLTFYWTWLKKEKHRALHTSTLSVYDLDCRLPDKWVCSNMH